MITAEDQKKSYYIHNDVVRATFNASVACWVYLCCRMCCGHPCMLVLHVGYTYVAECVVGIPVC